jgi:hypothetical protein
VGGIERVVVVVATPVAGTEVKLVVEGGLAVGIGEGAVITKNELINIVERAACGQAAELERVFVVLVRPRKLQFWTLGTPNFAPSRT